MLHKSDEACMVQGSQTAFPEEMEALRWVETLRRHVEREETR